MIRETELSRRRPDPAAFCRGRKNVQNPIPSMPGHYQLSIDHLVKAARTGRRTRHIPAVMLFGLPDKKDPLGTRAYAKDGIVQQAIQSVKERVCRIWW